ncbi:redoxin domain-containing protein [Anaerolineae bacterium CFX7]|nr:redoxin domain-containing protein [Anaerolineae bacterium CFX7]
MTERKIKIGDRAPEFKLRGSITKPDVKRVDVELAAYHGEKNIILAFHPFAFTAT